MTHCSLWLTADPQVKVVGLPANIQQARELILVDLDAKSTRVTLKIDVAFSEHSHVIGKEGANIKKGGCVPSVLLWKQFCYHGNDLYICAN